MQKVGVLEQEVVKALQCIPGVLDKLDKLEAELKDFKVRMESESLLAKECVKGLQGIPGIAGKRGNTGDPGISGERGEVGARGAMGPRGDRGDYWEAQDNTNTYFHQKKKQSCWGWFCGQSIERSH